jgi:lipoprotein-releasing system ATP-binding protein
MSAPETGRALTLRGVTRSFHKAGVTLDVLRGVDLDLAPGDAVALLGQSGSGKSTLLHILGGLEPPTRGEVLVDGTPLYARTEAQLDAYRRGDVGFVFQFHHLLPDHDALTNVAMPLRIAGAPATEARDRAEALLREVGLGQRLHHVPGELSGGEQQRVAIARALVARPGLVLADEPTGNLDPATASGVLDLLLAHARTLGATVVTVTHSLDLAERFPRRLRLREGRVEEAA